ncbi:unnamed protein product [Mytilus coruscus]|uniref:DUF5641 domain-containing protein n=1 Tax=Mytilus coruscus TaxID=42192 RepID=A0A6J8E765_MYTCO|nr:unnamed protein product [Mytilus coruscus]
MAELNAIEEDETESESSDNGSEIVKNSINEKYVEDQNKILSVHSRKQVISIKVANAGYPSIALERAWNRLDSRYGSPEKVESALKMKLSVVPKITYKDKNKLYELSDVLAEIRAHLRKDCQENIRCSECKGTSHTTAMHVFKIGSQDGIKSKPEASASNYGEEKSSKEEVVTKCTEVCKGGVGKSCAKIVLLDILHVQKPNTRMRIYAIIDEQSNSSLVHGDILDYFDIKAESRQYSLSSCSDHIDEVPSSFPLVTPDEDCEVRILKTTVGKEVPFGIHRFEHFSTWISLVRAVTTLKTKLRTICFGQDKNRRQVTREESQHFILQAVQKEFFSDEISALSVGEPLHKHKDFSSKDLFKKQWKGIQHLANQFWHRWKSEFLPSLQSRKKWQQDRKNVQEGDIVLMCDKSLHRNEWPARSVKSHVSHSFIFRKETGLYFLYYNFHKLPSSHDNFLLDNPSDATIFSPYRCATE